jgi:hypothetical protein
VTLLVHDLDASETEAVYAAIHALAALAVTLPASIRESFPIDLAVDEQPDAEPVLVAFDALVAALVRRAVQQASTPRDPELARLTTELRRATDAFTPLDAPGGKPSSPAAMQDLAIRSVSGRISEFALEEMDVAMLLGTHRTTDRLVLTWERETAAAIHVKLLERLHHRLELFCFTNPLLILERRASEWHFDRHSTPGTGSRAEMIDFARWVREQEWSLAERHPLSLEMPVAHMFALSSRFGTPCPARQLRLAEGLVRSAPGIFRVESRTGDETVYRHLGNERRYTVQEHNPDSDYEAGWIAMGRLIPVDREMTIRSPGMLTLKRRSEDSIVKLAQEMSRRDEVSILLEIAISYLVMANRNLPRRIPPAKSRAEAAELVQLLRQELDEIEMVETLDLADAPAELLEDMGDRLAAGTLGAESYDLDETLAEWMKALFTMSRPVKSSGSASRGGTRGKTKKRRRR